MTENKNELPRIGLPIVVEGRYDKSAILGMFSATVITTDGFAVFNSAEKQALIRRISKDGIIILTDPDGGGKQIRAFLSGLVPKDKLFQAYVPEIGGKERRKTQRSKAGILGVEGVGGEVLRRALLPFVSEGAPKRQEITAGLLYSLGLTGADNSSEKRDAIAASLGLPAKMTSKAFAAAVGIICSAEELTELAKSSPR